MLTSSIFVSLTEKSSSSLRNDETGLLETGCGSDDWVMLGVVTTVIACCCFTSAIKNTPFIHNWIEVKLRNLTTKGTCVGSRRSKVQSSVEIPCAAIINLCFMLCYICSCAQDGVELVNEN